MKIYRANLQSTNVNGNISIETIEFENTLGNVIWNKVIDNTGQLEGVLDGAFPENKVWFNALTPKCLNYYGGGGEWTRLNNDKVLIQLYDPSGNIANDVLDGNGVISVLIIVKE